MQSKDITSGNNLMREVIMLPEQMEATLERKHQRRVQTRPIVESQKLDQINRAIHESRDQKKPVTIIKFSPFGNQTITGIIEKIDMAERQVKIGNRWIFLSDIVGVDEG